MLYLNGRTLLLGGFHDHWSRAGGKNSALLLAALNYYHYDFMTLMDGPEHDHWHQAAALALSERIRIYPGREEMFGWGHVVTVNPKAPPLGPDQGDFRATLRSLKQSCDLVILAHPDYPGTWEQLYRTGEMDRLVDEGVVDGINLINTLGFDTPRHRELIAWFGRREQRGLCTPIVGGWDAHLLLPKANLSPALYVQGHPPRGHLDTGGTNRTILFCEENSLTAIVAAVRRGHTVIEDLANGELVGPAPLVSFLKENGYASEIRRLDEKRNAVKVSITVPWVAETSGAFCVNQPGYLKVATPTADGLKAGAIQRARDGTTDLQKSRNEVIYEAETEFVPRWLDVPDGRDQDYAALVYRDDQDVEAIWAVQTLHPIQLELLPCYREEKPGVELRALSPFEGEVAIKIEYLLDWKGSFKTPTLWLPIVLGVSEDYIHCATWCAKNTKGLVRKETTHLTFLPVPRFKNDWNSIPGQLVNSRFSPESAYGKARPYPGEEVYKLRAQFAWDERFLRFRTSVTDAHHFQPNRGHYVYNADCLQLALDPLLVRASSVGHVYSFNLALTSAGPELYRWIGPVQLANADFVCPPNDVSLGDRFLSVTRSDDGLIYELTLPWSELAPLQPQVGARLGVYLIGMNNDGHGLLDTLHWPLPVSGMWLVPRQWGVLQLV